jgi:hypothetical protein
MAEIKEILKKATKNNKGESLTSYKTTFETPTTNLEADYFWILDLIEGVTKGNVEKLIDNFISSPGSSQFADIGMRATKMQEEGMKILGLINQIVKTILNLVYDLKEFEIRLGHYEDANSKDKTKKETGILSLKQIWMDQVDTKKGNSSINAMAAQLGFSTLRDVFMISNSIEEVQKMEIINDQVKRILIPRLSDFLKWKEISEQELRKRFNIEKNYLKSEVEQLKLYTSWAIPYIRASKALQMRGSDKNPALVSIFNNTLSELTLFGKKEFEFDKAVLMQKLDKEAGAHKPERKYYSCFLITLKYRGIPQRITQNQQTFGGRVQVYFDSYAMNEDEIEVFKKELEKDNLKESIEFIQEGTTSSLELMKEDIEKFVNETPEKKQEEKKRELNDPFSILINSGIDLFKGIFKKSEQKKEKKKKPEKLEEIKEDNKYEKQVRKVLEEETKEALLGIYTKYKLAHKMIAVK